jgi:aspartate/methionine/tyrosine aminotransferase
MRPFAIERYFARYEHNARVLLSSSDCESLALADLLAMADDESLELWRHLSLGYTESPGLEALRREIAGLYRDISPDEVLEVVPEEGILLTMRALLEPGDHVVVTFPGYQSLYSIAADMGCEITPWEARGEGGWHFDLADLRAAMRPDTKLVVVNFPHNPTGCLPSASDFRAIADIASDAGAWLFSDEMYRWLEPDDADRLPSACETGARTVTLCGMSKTFSLPGLRVGWLVTRDADLMARLALLKDYTTICGSAPSEVLALMGLRSGTRIAAANRATIAASAAAVERLVASHPGLVSWTPPRAGSVALARFDVAGGTSMMCERLVEETGIMLLPSSVFEWGDAHVRFGLGRVGFARGVEQLSAWLDTTSPRSA